ncbi:hypothetical protein BD779DRAFT_779283 [Infundibulicybe gibba]|nr:hypothetical protein BD779DRAFT_779283 [Infundibulicybe gibba]
MPHSTSTFIDPKGEANVLPSSQNRKKSRRFASVDIANSENIAREAMKKALKRAHNNQEHAVVAKTLENHGNTEIRRSKEPPHQKAERDTAEAELKTAQTFRQHKQRERSIPSPPIAQITISRLRRDMDMDTGEDNLKWERMLTTVRYHTMTGGIDWDLRWKAQSLQELSKIYSAIEREHPVLRRFRGNWAVVYLVKKVFQDHRRARLRRAHTQTAED